MERFGKVAAFAIVAVALLPAWGGRAPESTAFSEWVDSGSPRNGLIPSPVDFSHLPTAHRAFAAKRKNSRFLALGASADDALPSKWDSREHGWVTPVRSQGNYGTCWAFATMACLETAILKDTSCAETNTFSPNHLANHNVGFELDFDDGGNATMSMALLSGWSDPLREDQDPYPNPGVYVDLPSACHVQNAIFLPYRTSITDNDTLKQAVRDYGAVGVAYYHNDSYFNDDTGAYYCSSSMSANHMVTLVGWDDEYSTNNFSVKPPSNGAFLIKNSWGKWSGDKGYTWISYCDRTFVRQAEMAIALPPPESTNNYGRVYQYDPCGYVQSYNVLTDREKYSRRPYTNWVANVFQSVATGIVEAVGFYSLAEGTEYTIRAYNGLTGTAPNSGTLVSEQKGTVDFAGFVTIKLATPVPIVKARERFAVAIALTSPETDYPIAVEESYSGYTACSANAGESFFSKDGASWNDFQTMATTANVCLKAYTRYGSDGPPFVASDVYVSDDASLAEAISTAIAGDRILVAPGTYKPFSGPSVQATIIATDGPAKTFINGFGSSRCYDGSANTDAVLSGFTLTGGFIKGYGGGAYCGTICNCIISNCVAYYGGGASYCKVVNSLIVSNRANSVTSGWGWMKRTDYGMGGGACECELYNTTVANNSAGQYGGGAYLQSRGYAVNTIVANNSSDGGYDYGNDIYGNAYYTTVTSMSDQDAKFVDADHGDWHLASDSPAIDAGSNEVTTVSQDLDGFNRISGTRVDIGCFEYYHAPSGWEEPQVSQGATAADEAKGVSNALVKVGFPSETAAQLKTVADYRKISEWANGNGIAAADYAKSPVAIISPALGAQTLLSITSEDLNATSMEMGSMSDGSVGVKMVFSPSAYEKARCDPSLLKAAVGVVGATTPNGNFTSDALDIVVEPIDGGIEVTVEPPKDAKAYFMRTKIR